MEAGVVVIGAGHAACQFAASLRQLGWKGALTLIGAEPHLPYQRPPLSKACLDVGIALADFLLRPAAFYESIACRLLAGRAVVAIDTHRKLVRKYHPDEPGIRMNYAKYYDAVETMDAEVGGALKDLEKYTGREKPQWVQIMASRKRKTLVLCHTCHMDIQYGRPHRNKVSRSRTDTTW